MKFPIHDRLARAEGDFLKAATDGLPALNLFHDAWSALVAEADFNLQTSTINEETKSLGISVASRIATISEHLLEFQTSADHMQKELEYIFASVGISDTLDDHATIRGSSHPSKDTLRSLSASATGFPHPASASCSSEGGNRLTYIAPAYRWLLANLHNPYPSREIRTKMSLQTYSERRVIDAWFGDARKRMGWNTLRKAHFSNKQVEIVDAATRFFIQEDPKRPLDPDVELKFAAMENRAKDLYSEKFSESILAVKLDVAVKDMTPEMKAQAKENERRRRQEEKENAKDVLAATSYPSPDRSPARTPAPSLSSASVPLSEGDIQSCESSAGNKRPRSSPVANDISDMDRPNKRHRSDSLSSAATTPIGLPSPAPSFQESREFSPPAMATSTSIPRISSRKRRLSDADLETYHAPKWPCNLPAWPRPHVVSHPLPLSSALPELSSIDDWFEEDFGIPKPVSVEVPDESIPVEVGLFDYSTINTGALPDIFDPSTRSTEQYHNLPLATEQSTLNQVPSYGGLEICTNDFNFDELFCDPEDATPELSGASLPHMSFDISPSFDLAPNSFDSNSLSSILFPEPIVDTAAIADFSTPISHNPASSIQWTFPPINSAHSLLGSLDELQTPGWNFAPIMFDPSILGLYTTGLPGDGVPPPSISADKAAKQRKLLEMQEAARQLAAEIAAS